MIFKRVVPQLAGQAAIIVFASAGAGAAVAEPLSICDITRDCSVQPTLAQVGLTVRPLDNAVDAGVLAICKITKDCASLSR